MVFSSSERGYRLSLALFSFLALLFSPNCEAASPGWQMKVHGVVSSLPVVPAFVLPGELVEIAAKTTGPTQLIAAAGTVAASSPVSWWWRAPEQPGLYPLELKRPQTGESVQIQAFVMVPFDRLQQGKVKGYRIGRYPAPKSPHYELPKGFVEVTPQNQNSLVAPHFHLKQFLCKQPGAFPKYVALTERLLVKLEMLLGRVNELGYHAATFHVMSGYRTPAYNRALGNPTTFSRHLFGDAADIYVEDPRTGEMADLNGDGKVDAKDAAILYNIVQDMSRLHPDLFPVGGAGTYERTHAHGPYIHVDARGFRAKWGAILKGSGGA